MTNETDKYRSFSIIGAARSGVAAAKLLKSKGYKVLLSDINPEEKINQDFLKEIKQNNIPFESGKHSEKVFENDMIVVSPGVPQSSAVLKKSFELGRDVVSEVELASWFCRGKIISITGTNGKTTTTTLIGELLKDAGLKSFVCGNIGTAFADVVENIGNDGCAVVETSSFQLDNIKTFKPFISILMNITPDHLDRYNHSYPEYIDSKFRVIENQTEDDYFIFDLDDEVIMKNLDKKVKVTPVPFSIKKDPGDKFNTAGFLDGNNIMFRRGNKTENIFDSRKLVLKGSHNIYNSLASILTAKILGASNESIAKTLQGFKGVEHRLEFVRELKGIKYYNDSKATNVNSVWYALQGFDTPIILILGGRDKGNDYSEIEKEVKKFVKHVIAIGESKEKVINYFKNKLPVDSAGDMEDAIKKAASFASENDIVLLSPACASFDMFDNYEHRGREFKRIVNEL
ncbi:MAG: UDP-N-acetylmuramoyl-L-alanine--D-glutamate ligase [Ignavibacteria bacterium]